MNHHCPFDKRDERAAGLRSEKRRGVLQMIHIGPCWWTLVTRRLFAAGYASVRIVKGYWSS
jgi:hypothetical protein